jgi:hypothetical protein
MRKGESSVSRRAIANRLERLETGRVPGRKLPCFNIHFVSPDGTVVSKLILGEDGQEEWWHAPGHGPQDVEGGPR